jgi:hypothetical protein
VKSGFTGGTVWIVESRFLMAEIRIASFAQLHQALQRYQRSNLWLFRGQADPNWPLVPKSGRSPFDSYDDRSLFEAWARMSVELAAGESRDTWDLLAVAQHHGLATRLLDWSFNPLIAAFFSVWESRASDAVLYAYYSRSKYVDSGAVSPFDFRGVRRFKPKGLAQRIMRQSGILTAHGPPTAELDRALLPGDVLEKIIIDHEYRSQLLFDLSFYGINRLSLFPDLDGLAAHINWATEHRVFWSGNAEETGEL